jgi:hypothetical protein
MKDDESTVMASARDNPGGDGMSVCPVHDQLTHDHERRMDELKEQGDKAFECIDDIRERCKEARETCQKTIGEAIGKRPTTGTLISVAGLFITLALGALVVFSLFIRGGLANLKESDSRLESAMTSYRDENKIWREKVDNKLEEMGLALVEIKKGR